MDQFNVVVAVNQYDNLRPELSSIGPRSFVRPVIRFRSLLLSFGRLFCATGNWPGYCLLLAAADRAIFLSFSIALSRSRLF